jgi:multidrug efflux pump subunit AcrB
MAVAVVVTPWAAARVLKGHARGAAGHAEEKEGWATRLYRVVMGYLIHHPPSQWAFLVFLVALLAGACYTVPSGFVKVKMLPFDNKSEFQVIVDMPEGATLERTAAVARELAQAVARRPEVRDLQLYAGTAAPYNFNGLVRHYYLRRGANVADIQVNLLPKHERREQSHAIAKAVRLELQPIAQRHGAKIKVAEVPPGPPVLQTLVAEVYGADAGRRNELARQIENLFRKAPGVVDVDTYIEDDQQKYRLEIDREKAALNGVDTELIAQNLRIALAGAQVGILHDPREREDVALLVRPAGAERSTLQDLRLLPIRGAQGATVPLGELVKVMTSRVDKSIYHKNLMPVSYVIADVAGEAESPIYALLALQPELDKLRPNLPPDRKLDIYYAHLPPTESRYAMKWDGELHITYEVFRDLGLAFAAVLVLIYVLVVGWFESFKTPLIIMAAIPFSLVGILPAHGLFHAFFSATSMIGFIAGAGIVVRNSIILVNFIELRLKEGMPLAEAVIDAGAVRFRPMALTAAAVVVGASVILFDPIFQGLAISLMAGEVASLLLSRMAVPVLYFIGNRRAARGARPSG